jgi:hypothetical protein
MSADNLDPDWERIEHDYRAGVLSLREIAAPFKVTEGAIRKRAKKFGWERDLNAKIHARAEALLVRREAVRTGGTQLEPRTEREIVESNAESIVRVRSEHRSDIARSRSLHQKLLAELEAQTGAPEDFETLGELLRAPDEKGMDKLNDLYRRATSLPGRIESAKKLSETMKNTVGLEREAYNIVNDQKQTPVGPLGELEHEDLKRLNDAIGSLAGAGVAQPASVGSTRH